MSNYARYVQWTVGSSSSGYIALCQIQVYVGTTNVAASLNATIAGTGTATYYYYSGGAHGAGTQSSSTITNGTTTQVLTDIPLGSINTGSYVQWTGTASVTIDLGSPQYLSSIEIWPNWMTNATPSGYWTINNVVLSTSLDGSSYAQVFQTSSITPSAITASQGYLVAPWCFVRGTSIRTPHGDRAIEDIREGNPVVTADGRVVDVREVRHTSWHVDADARLLPVRIPRGVLGATRDLLLSERHGVYVDGALVPAASIDGAERAADVHGVVDYFHLRLPQVTDLLVANGVPCESLRG
jgi:hypothetical protein